MAKFGAFWIPTTSLGGKQPMSMTLKTYNLFFPPRKKYEDLYQWRVEFRVLQDGLVDMTVHFWDNSMWNHQPAMKVTTTHASGCHSKESAREAWRVLVGKGWEQTIKYDPISSNT
jgi:hypothetical protein